MELSNEIIHASQNYGFDFLQKTDLLTVLMHIYPHMANIPANINQYSQIKRIKIE